MANQQTQYGPIPGEHVVVTITGIWATHDGGDDGRIRLICQHADDVLIPHANVARVRPMDGDPLGPHPTRERRRRIGNGSPHEYEPDPANDDHCRACGHSRHHPYHPGL